MGEKTFAGEGGAELRATAARESLLAHPSSAPCPNRHLGGSSTALRFGRNDNAWWRFALKRILADRDGFQQLHCEGRKDQCQQAMLRGVRRKSLPRPPSPANPKAAWRCRFPPHSKAF